MKQLLRGLIFCCLAAAAHAQVDFHAYLTSDQMLEGGRAETLSVVTSNLLFSLHPPRNWYREVDDLQRKIVFTAASGKSAITVLFTGDSPGSLPDQETLKFQALQAQPGAGFVLFGSIQTTSQPAEFVDMVRMLSPGVIQRFRHAYVADPAGRVEFILAATDDEFPQRKETLSMMLRSLAVKPAPLR